MPIYDYKCDSCGHQFEALQSMKDMPLCECEKCGKSVRKLFSSGTGIIFKGSGFYVNDYKSDSSKKGGGCSCSGCDK
ncbi:MAG: FmdB family zinc ribbon protein [Spirochaetota bacterium]